MSDINFTDRVNSAPNGTSITGKTAVTAVGTDYVLISDTSDSGNLKKALASDFTGGAATTVSRSSRFGWVFPDNTINAATDIAAETWHTISAMWYELDASGNLVKRDTSGYGSNFYYTAANALIVRNNSVVSLVNVSNGSAANIDSLCSNSTKRATAISTLITFCESNNFDGVDLDFEDFNSWTAGQYTNFKTFVSELGFALHASGLILSVEVPPIWNTAANTESGSGDAWDSANSQGYYQLTYLDFNSLPVDQVVVMCYDYQYDYSAGEPNSPLKWTEEILEFARNKFNENKIKIIVGLPSAGYSGTTGGYSVTGRTYSYLSIQTGFSGASRDALSGELIWANGGISYAACDDTTIQLKVASAESIGIFTYALWHIGDNKYGGDSLTNTNKQTQNYNNFSTTKTANTIALRDASANLSAVNFIPDFRTTVTAAGTTTLVVGDAYNQFFTGATTQTVVLPVVTTLTTGHTFFIKNNSSGVVTVNSSGGNLVASMAGGTSLFVRCILTTGTTAASWDASITGLFYAAGKTLTISNTMTLAGTDGTTITLPSTTGTVALNNQTHFIGTTSVAINRASAGLTLAGITLTTPNIGAATGTSLSVNGLIRSSGSAGIGYATGAGGTVTQATSKATAFTLSTATGTIQFAADALASQTSVSSTWTNTTLVATDQILLTHVSGGTLGAYSTACLCASGSATITIRNTTGGSLSEAPVFRFSVMKSVNA